VGHRTYMGHLEKRTFIFIDFSAFPKLFFQKIRKLENDFMNAKSVMEYGN
jgi:hypothetical protein